MLLWVGKGQGCCRSGRLQGTTVGGAENVGVRGDHVWEAAVAAAVSSLSGAGVATMLQSLINMPRRFTAHHQIRKQDQGVKEPAWILMVPGKLGSSG